MVYLCSRIENKDDDEKTSPLWSVWQPVYSLPTSSTYPWTPSCLSTPSIATLYHSQADYGEHRQRTVYGAMPSCLHRQSQLCSVDVQPQLCLPTTDFRYRQTHSRITQQHCRSEGKAQCPMMLQEFITPVTSL